MIIRSLSVFVTGSLLAGCVAFAQQSASTPAQQPGSAPAQRRPIPAPTNLKVLPKDTTGQQVIVIMRGFEGDLGVDCSFCHAKDPVTGRNNFASDANPLKDTARVMMKMTGTINTQYLTQLTDPKPENPVTCGTCHQGMSVPAVFVPKRHERPAGPQPAGAPPAPTGADAPPPH